MKTGQSRIDSVLSQVVASGRIANVVAMAANENESLYSGAYGLLDSKRNIELNSIFLYLLRLELTVVSYPTAAGFDVFTATWSKRFS